MNRHFLVLLAVGLFARPAIAAPVEITDAWVQAVPPSSSATAAFMTIVNPADHPVRITRCSSPAAGETTPMITTHQTIDGKDVMGMETVEALEIPAGGRRALAPGGDHIMLMEMPSAPKVGDTVELTLVIEPGAQEVKLQLPVRMTHEE